jgi:hypothetical protein
MCMRRRVAPAARARPMVPVEPTAGGAALYSAVQLRHGPRAAHGPSWARSRRYPAEHATRCRSCGVANHDGVVNQVGPSGTAHGSSELVKAHTPRRGTSRPSCRNNSDPGPVTGAGPTEMPAGGPARFQPGPGTPADSLSLRPQCGYQSAANRPNRVSEVTKRLSRSPGMEKNNHQQLKGRSIRLCQHFTLIL